MQFSQVSISQNHCLENRKFSKNVKYKKYGKFGVEEKSTEPFLSQKQFYGSNEGKTRIFEPLLNQLEYEVFYNLYPQE